MLHEMWSDTYQSMKDKHHRELNDEFVGAKGWTENAEMFIPKNSSKL